MIEQLISALKKSSFDKKKFEIVGSIFSPDDAKQLIVEIEQLTQKNYKQGFSDGLYAARDALNKDFGL